MEPKYARRTIGQIKEIIAQYVARGPDETTLQAATRLGVHREQITRWRRDLKTWAAAGYTDEQTPCIMKTRIRHHLRKVRAKA